VDIGPPAERLAPPRPLWRMLRYEARRWAGQFTVPALLAAPAALGVVAVWFRHGKVLRDAEAVAAGELVSATDVTAFEGVATALQAGLPLAPYVLLGLASQSLSGELSQGSLRNVLLRPLHRLHILLGKSLALLCAALACYLLLAGAALLSAAWAFDFTDLAEILPNGKRFPLLPADEIWPELRRTLLTPLLPLLGYAGLGFLCGAIVRRGATGLALALGCGVFVDLFRAVARGYDTEGWLLSAYLPSPLGGTSYPDYYFFFSQGVSNVEFQFAATEWLVPLAWIAASLILASWVFVRRFVP